MDNLPELRDIHIPTEGISMFPLAYGWWGILLLVVMVFILIKSVIILRKTSARIYARKLLLPLKDSYELSAAVKMSEILRRICIRKYPDAVSLFGDEWVKFLNNKSKYKLDEKSAELLKNAPFMHELPNNYTKEDLNSLWNFCEVWVGENL